MEKSQEIVNDSITLARIEGLEGHARAAECRLLGASSDKTTESPHKKIKT